MRYLLLVLFAPGSFALILLVVRSAVRTAQRFRSEDEDAQLRTRRRYDVPECAVRD